jgi:hypothetical protein
MSRDEHSGIQSDSRTFLESLNRFESAGNQDGSWSFGRSGGNRELSTILAGTEKKKPHRNAVWKGLL